MTDVAQALKDRHTHTTAVQALSQNEALSPFLHLRLKALALYRCVNKYKY